MRIFDEPNLFNDWTCPICGTSDIEPVVLVSIDGTEKDGIVQAEQIHLSCINLRIISHENKKALVQFYE